LHIQSIEDLGKWFNPLHQTGDVTTDEPISVTKNMNEFRMLRTTNGRWFA
jgi:hypothetical protein